MQIRVSVQPASMADRENPKGAPGEPGPRDRVRRRRSRENRDGRGPPRGDARTRAAEPRSRGPSTSSARAGRMARHATTMQEHLDGETYGGRYIVADIGLGFAWPPSRSRIAVGADGFVLFAPLPGGALAHFRQSLGSGRAPGPASRRRSREAAQRAGRSRRRIERSSLGLLLQDAQEVRPVSQRRSGGSCWAMRRISRAPWGAKGSTRR